MEAIISESRHQEEIAEPSQTDPDALLSAVAADAEAIASLKADFRASDHAGRMAFIEKLLNSKNPDFAKMLSDLTADDGSGDDRAIVPKLCDLVRTERRDRMTSIDRLKVLADLVAGPEKAP